jgi:hypothetical protein
MYPFHQYFPKRREREDKRQRSRSFPHLEPFSYLRRTKKLFTASKSFLLRWLLWLLLLLLLLVSKNYIRGAT